MFPLTRYPCRGHVIIVDGFPPFSITPTVLITKFENQRCHCSFFSEAMPIPTTCRRHTTRTSNTIEQGICQHIMDSIIYL